MSTSKKILVLPVEGDPRVEHLPWKGGMKNQELFGDAVASKLGLQNIIWKDWKTIWACLDGRRTVEVQLCFRDDGSVMRQPVNPLLPHLHGVVAVVCQTVSESGESVRFEDYDKYLHHDTVLEAVASQTRLAYARSRMNEELRRGADGSRRVMMTGAEVQQAMERDQVKTWQSIVDEIIQHIRALPRRH